MRNRDTKKRPAKGSKALEFLRWVRVSLHRKGTIEWSEIGSAASILVSALREGHRVYYVSEGHMTPLATTFGTRGNPGLFFPIDESDLLAELPSMKRYDGDVLIVSPQFDATPSLDRHVLQAKLFGAKVICIGTPTDRRVVPTSLPSKSLTDISDVVINVHTPPGDALLSFPGLKERVGPTSGIMAVSAFYALAVEVASELAPHRSRPA